MLGQDERVIVFELRTHTHGLQSLEMLDSGQDGAQVLHLRSRHANDVQAPKMLRMARTEGHSRGPSVGTSFEDNLFQLGAEHEGMCTCCVTCAHATGELEKIEVASFQSALPSSDNECVILCIFFIHGHKNRHK